MTNYQKELDQLIEQLGGQRPTLLLHSCCGPCSSYVLEYLSTHFEVTLYYFNPCIYPAEEYTKRLLTQKQLLESTGQARLMESEYEHMSFIDLVRGYEGEKEGGARCEVCFRQRLFETARAAAEQGFDYFATTLTVSPHKNAPLLNRICQEAEKLYGVAHLPSDFKKKNGYKRSVELSTEYGLYRQDYCGCEFSKAESELIKKEKEKP